MKKLELILVISLIVVFVSGFLMHPFHDVHMMKMIHAVSSLVVMVCAIFHIKRYCKVWRRKR